MSAVFDVLARELDAWGEKDMQATLWWRDDDAERDSPQLRRLLAIARAHGVPIAIAAIPAGADRTLAAAIADCPPASVVQHGYAHANHAPAGERSAELGAQRSVPERVAELDRGREALRTLFAHRFVPVLVPPWNRIAGDLIGVLPGAEARQAAEVRARRRAGECARRPDCLAARSPLHRHRRGAAAPGGASSRTARG